MTSLLKKKGYPMELAQERRDVLYDEEILRPFLPNQPVPVGFIYPLSSERSSDNPCVLGATYNSSCKPNLNDIAGRTSSTENNEKNELKEEEDCSMYCIIGLVILVIVCVIIGIVYFLIQHPKLARNIYKAISDEADDNDDGGATPLGKITAAELGNKASAVTFKPPRMRDNDWDTQPNIYED